jgi:hypothetical protein
VIDSGKMMSDELTRRSMTQESENVLYAMNVDKIELEKGK